MFDPNKKLINPLGEGTIRVSEVRLLLRGIVNRAERSGKKLKVHLSGQDRALLAFLGDNYDWSLPYGGEEKPPEDIEGGCR